MAWIPPPNAGNAECAGKAHACIGRDACDDAWHVDAGNAAVVVVATDITEGRRLADNLHTAMHAKSRFLANMSHEVII